MTIKECRELDKKVHKWTFDNDMDCYPVLNAEANSIYLYLEHTRETQSEHYADDVKKVKKEFNLKNASVIQRKDYTGRVIVVVRFLMPIECDFVIGEKSETMIYFADGKGFTISPRDAESYGEEHVWDTVMKFLQDNPNYSMRAKGSKMIIRKDKV